MLKKIIITFCLLWATYSNAQTTFPSLQNSLQGKYTASAPHISQIWTTSTYKYVDCTNGNDSGSGSSISPWKTLAHAVSVLGSTAANTVVNVLPGTCVLTSNDSGTNALSITTGGSSDTQSGYFVLHSTTPHGARLVPATNTYQSVLNAASSYVVIDGFDVDGQGGSQTGIITNANGTHHIIITNNYIHNNGGEGIGFGGKGIAGQGGDCYYFAGNDVWNNAFQGQAFRFSGISVYEPNSTGTGCTNGGGSTYFKNYQIGIVNNLTYNNGLGWSTILGTGTATFTGSGTGVTWVSGTTFDLGGSMNGATILVNTGGTQYTSTLSSSSPSSPFSETLQAGFGGASGTYAFTILNPSTRSDGNGIILDDWSGSQAVGKSLIADNLYVTTSGTSTVTYQGGGGPFTSAMNGGIINLGGVDYSITSYVDSTHITVSPTPPTFSSASYANVNAPTAISNTGVVTVGNSLTPLLNWYNVLQPFTSKGTISSSGNTVTGVGTNFGSWMTNICIGANCYPVTSGGSTTSTSLTVGNATISGAALPTQSTGTAYTAYGATYSIASFTSTSSVTLSGWTFGTALSGLKFVAAGYYQNKGLVQGNLSFNNGGAGINAFFSENLTIANNTAWGNFQDSQNTQTTRSDLFAQAVYNVAWLNNIAQSSTPTPPSLQILSGTYNSTTGLITLNLNAPLSPNYTGSITVSGATGTGSNLSAVNVTNLQPASINGSSVTYLIATGQTITTITGGLIASNNNISYTQPFTLSNYFALNNGSNYASTIGYEPLGNSTFTANEFWPAVPFVSIGDPFQPTVYNAFNNPSYTGSANPYSGQPPQLQFAFGQTIPSNFAPQTGSPALAHGTATYLQIIGSTTTTNGASLAGGSSTNIGAY